MKNKLRFTFLVFLGLFCCSQALSQGCDGAGSCYVRAGSSCTSSCGANWTNAYQGFGTSAGYANPSSLTRGVTYWLAAGTYNGATFGTPTSGSNIVTIEAPTTSNHGGASDWSASYQGQAVFSGSVTFSTAYWVMNGQQRGSPNCVATASSCTIADWRTGYQIKISSGAGSGGGGVNLSANNVSLYYVEVAGRNAYNVDDFGINQNSTNLGSNFIFDHGYIHDTGNSTYQMNDGTISNVTIAYSYNFHHHAAEDSSHDEQLAVPMNNVYVHHNVFQDNQSTAVWSDASGGTPSDQGWYFYGNIIFADNAFWTGAYDSHGNGGGGKAALDNGVLHLNGTNAAKGPFYVYNNTFVNTQSAVANAGWLTWNNTPPGSTFVVQNNVTCNGGNTQGTDGSTQDYNSYYCGDKGASGSHDSTSSSNPFANPFPSAFGGNWDASLSSAGETSMGAGVTLPSPYDTSCDVDNGWCVNGPATLARGSSGKWDRGALQLSGTTSTQQPNPPTSLQVTQVQ